MGFFNSITNVIGGVADTGRQIAETAVSNPFGLLGGLFGGSDGGSDLPTPPNIDLNSPEALERARLAEEKAILELIRGGFNTSPASFDPTVSDGAALDPVLNSTTASRIAQLRGATNDTVRL